MKKIVKRILKIIFLVIVVLIVLFSVSYIFPGNIKVIDQIRLKGQTELLKFIGEAHVTDFIPYEYGDEEEKHLLEYDELAKYVGKLSTGDVFFTESENYLSSEFTPGQWKHSVIYIGTKDELEEVYTEGEAIYELILPLYQTGEEIVILDASKDGVAFRTLDVLSNISDYSYMKSSIGFSFNTDISLKKEFIEYAVEQMGKGYDYDMDTEDDSSLYCSEFLYVALLDIGIYVDNITEMLARTAVSPTDVVDYLNEDERFTQIFYIQKAEDEIIEDIY